MNELQKYIVSCRRSLGWTQQRLAREMGVAPSYISDIECGRRTAPTTKIMERFAEATKCNRDLLYYYTGRIAPELQGRESPLAEAALSEFRKIMEGSK